MGRWTTACPVSFRFVPCFAHSPILFKFEPQRLGIYISIDVICIPSLRSLDLGLPSPPFGRHWPKHTITLTHWGCITGLGRRRIDGSYCGTCLLRVPLVLSSSLGKRRATRLRRRKDDGRSKQRLLGGVCSYDRPHPPSLVLICLCFLSAHSRLTLIIHSASQPFRPTTTDEKGRPPPVQNLLVSSLPLLLLCAKEKEASATTTILPIEGFSPMACHPAARGQASSRRALSICWPLLLLGLGLMNMLLVKPTHAQPGYLQNRAAAHIDADGAFRYVSEGGTGERKGKISRRKRDARRVCTASRNPCMQRVRCRASERTDDYGCMHAFQCCESKMEGGGER